MRRAASLRPNLHRIIHRGHLLTRSGKRVYFAVRSTLYSLVLAVRIFDLLFLFAFLTSVVTLVRVAIVALRGNRVRALRVLRNFAVAALLYLAVGLAVSLVKPQRVIGVREPWCFDDWCLSVQNVSRTPETAEAAYRVDLRIFSQARRVTQRAKGAWIYLVDEHGRRYAPESDPSAVPLSVLLHPQESVATSRVFRVPADVQGLGLITGHGGPYCGPMEFLVIGESGCLFNKPTMIRIQ